MLRPPNPNSPEGIYWFYLETTGDEALAHREKMKAIILLKERDILRGG
ncbi:MAG: hypothetical protein ACIALR_01420 [Blastopirellula sp. JB062]